MLVGLILAATSIYRECRDSKLKIAPIVYLRSDIWNELQFSDNNKLTQSLALNLEWKDGWLKELINTRLQAKVSRSASWETVSEQDLMRGSQPKFNHILARTFLRPRDVIQFLNAALAEANKRMSEPLIFINKDIVAARDQYSRYLKQELDDEILAHWRQWDEALQACSSLRKMTFKKADFAKEYIRRRSAQNTVDTDEALEKLYDFSVIGYERRSGYGGTSWAFEYADPEAGWDSAATRFKVHLGLKEYAKLREERRPDRDVW
jgi:hypothetical protein